MEAGAAALGGPMVAPELAFEVVDADIELSAAVPTLRFHVRIDTPATIRSLALNCQIRIAPTRRGYGEHEEGLLGELFGGSERWGETMRGFVWTHAHLAVPPFSGTTVAELLVPCTYDFEVTASKYMAALGDGEIPLELLFSGTIFYAGEGGMLRTAMLPWDREAEYRLPVSLWRALMDRYFPGRAWLRVGRETFERLYAYRARNSYLNWEQTLDALLDEVEGDER